MTRAVFQVQSEGTDVASVDHIKVKRGQDKSLPVDEQTVSLMDCLPFTKPKQRCEPPRHKDAYQSILSCCDINANVSDPIWVLLRLLSRDIVDIPFEFPRQNERMIQFWTGFYSKVTESHTRQTLMTYASVVDSKPSDMNTVFTTMKKCMDMSKVIQYRHLTSNFMQYLNRLSGPCLMFFELTFCD